MLEPIGCAALYSLLRFWFASVSLPLGLPCALGLFLAPEREGEREREQERLSQTWYGYENECTYHELQCEVK
eukprot:1969009-Amphidinium_carterae.1